MFDVALFELNHEVLSAQKTSKLVLVVGLNPQVRLFERKRPVDTFPVVMFMFSKCLNVCGGEDFGLWYPNTGW